jgi:hypothetical protein
MSLSLRLWCDPWILDGIQLMGNDKYCSSQISTRIRGFTTIMGMNATGVYLAVSIKNLITSMRRSAPWRETHNQNVNLHYLNCVSTKQQQCADSPSKQHGHFNGRVGSPCEHYPDMFSRSGNTSTGRVNVAKLNQPTNGRIWIGVEGGGRGNISPWPGHMGNKLVRLA